MLKPHVLVVDDSLIVRMDLRGALMAAGFDVTACETKRDAYALLDQRTFHAVVLDVILPDGNGVEILQRIRADVKHVNMPVVMLSAEADVRNRVRGLTMGADEYVGKPYNIAYFIRRLRELCHVGRTSQLPPSPVVGCRRILAVDDSPTFLHYVAQILRQDGHDVVLARSGREALDMLAVQTIDCVVLDLHMPELDGIETLRQIRHTPGRESTPTLMLTASQNPADQQNAIETGINEFLHKDATVDVVRAKIRSLLREQHAESTRVEHRNDSSRKSLRPIAQSESNSSSTPVSQRDRSWTVMGTPAPSVRRPLDDFSPVFVEATSAMGLSDQLARGTLVKILDRLSIDPRKMNRDDLSRALPLIRQALSMYFSAEEILPRIDALVAIAAR